jgi:hypothetical protein
VIDEPHRASRGPEDRYVSFNEEHALETYKSMISVGTEALKALQLLNGGAIIALLTYLGHASARLCLAPRATCPVTWFITGLLAGTAAFVTTYFTQLALYNESVLRAKKRHPILLWLTVVLALLSLLAFGVGAFTSIAALSKPC